MARERFVEMAGGSAALPMIGWLKDEDEVTGWLDLERNVLRPSGEVAACTSSLSDHTLCWNYVRDMALAAATADRGGRSNFWPENPVTCLLSLAMRVGDAKAGPLDNWAETKGAVRAALKAVDSPATTADREIRLLKKALLAFALGLGKVAAENDVGGLRDIANALSVATVDDA